MPSDARSLAITLGAYGAAAFFEIAGCYAIWAIVRLGASAWWAAAGVGALLLFALLLTRADLDFAGRAYAAYGGIYIVASLLWLWGVEGRVPDPWDMAGAGLSIAGALVILLGRHAS